MKLSLGEEKRLYQSKKSCHFIDQITDEICQSSLKKVAPSFGKGYTFVNFENWDFFPTVFTSWLKDLFWEGNFCLLTFLITIDTVIRYQKAQFINSPYQETFLQAIQENEIPNSFYFHLFRMDDQVFFNFPFLAKGTINKNSDQIRDGSGSKIFDLGQVRSIFCC